MPLSPVVLEATLRMAGMELTQQERLAVYEIDSALSYRGEGEKDG